TAGSSRPRFGTSQVWDSCIRDCTNRSCRAISSLAFKTCLQPPIIPSTRSGGTRSPDWSPAVDAVERELLAQFVAVAVVGVDVDRALEDVATLQGQVNVRSTGGFSAAINRDPQAGVRESDGLVQDSA